MEGNNDYQSRYEKKQRIEKQRKSQNQNLVEISKHGKPLAKLTKKERKKNQIIKIGNERGGHYYRPHRNKRITRKKNR